MLKRSFSLFLISFVLFSSQVCFSGSNVSFQRQKGSTVTRSRQKLPPTPLNQQLSAPIPSKHKRTRSNSFPPTQKKKKRLVYKLVFYGGVGCNPFALEEAKIPYSSSCFEIRKTIPHSNCDNVAAILFGRCFYCNDKVFPATMYHHVCVVRVDKKLDGEKVLTTLSCRHIDDARDMEWIDDKTVRVRCEDYCGRSWAVDIVV